MTIINSIREVASLPGQGISNACQPVLGYNYGAGRNDRVIQGIKFVTFSALSMMLNFVVCNYIFSRIIY